MKGGRKNLKRAAEEEKFNLQDGQTIMQVLSLRGSNLIELWEFGSHWTFKLQVQNGFSRSLNLSRKATPKCLGAKVLTVMDGQGEKSLALFPAKFQKSMWIRRGSFVVVDMCGKEKALESVARWHALCPKFSFMNKFTLFRNLQSGLKSTHLADSSGSLCGKTSQQEDDELESSDEEGLPPIEVNTNRIKPFELLSDAESDLGSDRDS